MVSPNDSENDHLYAFIGKLDTSKSLLKLLKAVNVKDRANFFISPDGIKVTVEDSRSMQITALMQAHFFEEFVLREGRGDEENSSELAFSIKLNILISCLDMYGENDFPQVKICYKGFGNPLQLFVSTQGEMIDCAIKTMEVEDCMNFNFADSSVINKFILDSDMFKEVVAYLDPNCESVRLEIKKDQFRFSTTSTFGDSEAKVTSNSRMMEKYMYNAPASNNYKYSFLKLGLKPLAISDKVSLQVDSRDFICIQHKIHPDGEGQAFLEFYCVPDIDD